MVVRSLCFFWALLIWSEFESKNSRATGQVPDISIGSTPYGTCGDCYCVPERGGECPNTQLEEGYTGVRTANGDDDLGNLKNQEAVNPIILGCNPFMSEFCETQPPRQFRYDLDADASAKAVCGILYKKPRFGCPNEYALVSYASEEEANAAPAVITHKGACGVCSTTKDLAVMMTTRDFNSLLAQCTFTFFLQGINVKNFLECVQELGITPDCAKMLYWTSRANADQCSDVCTADATTGIQGQGPPPNCDPSPCTRCALEKTGQFSASFLGRLPINSGVLSVLAPPCEEFYNLTHNACPRDKVYPVFPTSSPTGEAGSSGQRNAANSFMMFALGSFCGLVLMLS